jgi:hypothetical protein
LSQVPINKGVNAKYFVPASDPGAEDWRAPAYNDAAWSTAALAFGWDTSGPYLDLLGSDGNLSSVAKGVNASIYVRVPITIDDPSTVKGWFLISTGRMVL